ncbi:hypothetical protein HYFRA_00009908 [Hymenoscyphus fraxineus]|uniref:Uncharacterized protein n=1 Tax=Hymenoscyphus fraxineus TaxID=746836 RepID=A0A9N9L4U0_9HELO|nr:hypothetical protein HYFRA_00009908 [Hymenoscyphus fraxineus]
MEFPNSPTVVHTYPHESETANSRGAQSLYIVDVIKIIDYQAAAAAAAAAANTYDIRHQTLVADEWNAGLLVQ